MVVVLTAAATLLVYASASSQHAITWLVSERGFPYSRAAFLSAGVILAAGLLGSLAIGALADRALRLHPAGRLLVLARRECRRARGRGRLLHPAAGIVGLFISWFVAQAYLLGWFGSLVAAVAERAPADRRATVSASCCSPEPAGRRDRPFRHRAPRGSEQPDAGAALEPGARRARHADPRGRLRVGVACGATRAKRLSASCYARGFVARRTA